MWYYVKDNRKVGPIADVALKSLYGTGKISRRTRVWTMGMSDWQELENTSFFERITNRVSYAVLDFEFRTRLFRAFLLSYTILTLSFIFLDYKRLNYFDFMSLDSSSVAVLKCVGVEYHKISMITGFVIFAIFLMLLKTAFDWIFRVVKDTSIWRKDFIVSPTYAAWSIFIPVINLIQPFQILKRVYKYSKIASGRKYTIYDKAFLLLWCFFTLFAVLIFVLENVLFTSQVTLETVSGIFLFKMYFSLMMAIALSFWIVFVSRVSKYQKESLLKYGGI